MKHTRFAAHHFHDTVSPPFSPKEYSRLKFGSDSVAKKFGYQLADHFAAHHLPTIIGRKLLVIPSPYNYVKNAATIMTEHFVDRLNSISVTNNGEHVEASIIHRNCTYTKDYGHLSKEDRKGLLDGDAFYINDEFIKDKVLLCMDDVIITGTHEDKIKDLLEAKGIENDVFFLYFAQYHGSNPQIEAEINFANIQSFKDYQDMLLGEDNHIIIRPLKFILSQPESVVKSFVKSIPIDKLDRIYYGCLAEGYYKLPDYQANFALIKQQHENR